MKTGETIKNISTVIRNNLCVTCGTCVTVCPRSCLKINQTSENGYSKPFFVNNECNSCGLCIDACPGHSYWFSEDVDGNLGNCIKAYTAHANNKDIRFNSSSGGAVTMISLYLLENQIVDGIITTRMAKEHPLLPEGFIATSRKDILEASGSKYSPVPLNKIFRNLDSEKNYAFIGMGCHVYGMKKYIKKMYPDKNPIYITLGLFCSRTPSFNATKFLLAYNGIKQNDVSSIKYRGNGRPGKLTIQLKNGETRLIDHLDYSYWGFAFFNFFMQYRCWLCNDKTAVLSDISFADDWTVGLSKDTEGSSSIVARTQKGLDLIEKLNKENLLVINETDPIVIEKSQALDKKVNTFTRQRIAVACFGSVPIKLDVRKKETRLFLRELFMFIRLKLSSFPFIIQKTVVYVAWLLQKKPDYPCLGQPESNFLSRFFGK